MIFKLTNSIEININSLLFNNSFVKSKCYIISIYNGIYSNSYLVGLYNSLYIISGCTTLSNVYFCVTVCLCLMMSFPTPPWKMFSTFWKFGTLPSDIRVWASDKSMVPSGDNKAIFSFPTKTAFLLTNCLLVMLLYDLSQST